MILDRISFLESLVQESARLKLVFLNHAGAPETLLSDISSIDLLADREGYHSFISFCKSHKLVNYISTVRRFGRMQVVVNCNDGSELNFLIVSIKIRQSLSCLPNADIRKEAVVNSTQMLVPSVKHHFEYILLKNQYSKSAFPDKFQKYFSGLSTSERTEIFRYIQPKYNLVFNTIEDLYSPKGGVLLKITIGLRKLKENSLFRMAGRLISMLAFSVYNLFSNSRKFYYSEGSSSGSVSRQKAARKKVAN